MPSNVETSDREADKNGDLVKQNYEAKDPAEPAIITQNAQKPPIPITGIGMIGDQKRVGSAMPRKAVPMSKRSLI